MTFLIWKFETDTFHSWDVFFNFSSTAIAMHRHLQRHHLHRTNSLTEAKPIRLEKYSNFCFGVFFDKNFCFGVKNTKRRRKRNKHIYIYILEKILTLGFNWKANVCFPATTSFNLSNWLFSLVMSGFCSNSSWCSTEFMQKQELDPEERQRLSSILPRLSLPISHHHKTQIWLRQNLPTC